MSSPAGKGISSWPCGPMRPDRRILNSRGAWSGGFDVARIPRRGNYARAHILTALNSPGDEWALAPHPVSGGWLATDGRSGGRRVDPWWIRGLPGVADENTMDGETATLAGLPLTVRCAGEPIAGVRWTLEDAGTGMPVMELVSDADGRVALDGLPVDRGTRWVAERPAGVSCATAMAEWTDGAGQVIQRFSLMGDVWRLNLLAAMAIGGWEVNAIDRSSLPALSPLLAGNRPADWVVFHAVGSPSVSKQGSIDLEAWALACREAEDVQVLVMGHASPDGLAQDNVRLAKGVPVRWPPTSSSPGVPPQRIRVEVRVGPADGSLSGGRGLSRRPRRAEPEDRVVPDFRAAPPEAFHALISRPCASTSCGPSCTASPSPRRT